MKTDINGSIIIENKWFRLTVGEDCISKSLIFKPTGEECLMRDEDIALFSSTQNRPYHNEVKLAHPNKLTTYQADRIRTENGKLIVGFETVPYEAVIAVDEQDSYIAFTLEDFIAHEELYGGLIMSLPPVEEFRILQLPVRNREKYGEWLNVSTGNGVSVNVLGTSEYPRIDSERRKKYRVMYADCRKEVKLKGVGAALIVSSEDELLNCIDSLEHSFGLPLGVESRRRDEINASIYWTANINPDNIDEHIAYAKQGGFRMMLLYIEPLIGSSGYDMDGQYSLVPPFSENGNLKKMVEKIKAAGIIPGLHFLQTFIGCHSMYIKPSADPRLGLVRHFTLSKAIPADDDSGIIYVNENPEGCVMAERARILRFAGELISYENYSAQRPYCFTGCKRGTWDTNVTDHPCGEIGGILDVCEFGARSVYIDQKTDLQDEVAEKIAGIYDMGFEFIYFDGSEGANPPFEFNVPNAQYRVLKKLGSSPIYTMGAAKAHFSWHFLSGGNAFDIFPPEVFKAMIDKYPAEEAGRVSSDLTCVNFGWWAFWGINPSGNSIGTQADMYEYGTSRAAAWDCPITLQENISLFRSHPRTDDILEVVRRWEDVRARKWLTTEQKNMLRQLGPEHEHILLINENGDYELVPYRQIHTAAGGNEIEFRAFVFERAGYSWAVYWHPTGNTKVSLPVCADSITLFTELNLAPVPFERNGDSIILPLDSRKYIRSSLSAEELVSVLEKAEIIR